MSKSKRYVTQITISVRADQWLRETCEGYDISLNDCIKILLVNALREGGIPRKRADRSAGFATIQIGIPMPLTKILGGKEKTREAVKRVLDQAAAEDCGDSAPVVRLREKDLVAA